MASLTFLLPNRLHSFFGRPDSIRNKSKIHQCGLVAIAFLDLSGRCGIGDDRDLKALFAEFSHVGLHTEIRRHSAEDDLIDTALSQLQYNVVGLWSKHLMWAGNYSGVVLDNRL